MTVALADPAPTALAAELPARPVLLWDPPLSRLSVAQYHQMIEQNPLTPKDRVELLLGLLVHEMPEKQPYNTTSGKFGDGLIRLLPPGWYVAREEAVWAANDSEPEPDVTVVRGSRNDYPDTPPQGRDVARVVADSSLACDKSEKKRIYAAAGIPYYWLANLPERRIEVYSDSIGPEQWPDYRRRTDHAPGDVVPVVLDGVEVGWLAVRELLPIEGA
jgi:Uma2 family endonuclease